MTFTARPRASWSQDTSVVGSERSFYTIGGPRRVMVWSGATPVSVEALGQHTGKAETLKCWNAERGWAESKVQSPRSKVGKGSLRSAAFGMRSAEWRG